MSFQSLRGITKWNGEVQGSLYANYSGWCSTPTLLLICSSFSRENGHPLLICSSLSTAQIFSCKPPRIPIQFCIVLILKWLISAPAPEFVPHVFFPRKAPPMTRQWSCRIKSKSILLERQCTKWKVLGWQVNAGHDRVGTCKSKSITHKIKKTLQCKTQLFQNQVTNAIEIALVIIGRYKQIILWWR